MISGLSTEWTEKWKTKRKNQPKYGSNLPDAIDEELRRNWVTRVDQRKKDKLAWQIGTAIIISTIISWIIALIWLDNIIRSTYNG